MVCHLPSKPAVLTVVPKTAPNPISRNTPPLTPLIVPSSATVPLLRKARVVAVEDELVSPSKFYPNKVTAIIVANAPAAASRILMADIMDSIVMNVLSTS